MTDFSTRPLGVYFARVDPKGRLRLPADFRHALGDIRQFFVTAIENTELRLYPRSCWEKLWDNPDSAPLRVNAETRGGEAEIDAEGRLLIPRDLRVELALTDAPVVLHFSRDHIALFSESVYKTRREQASASLTKATEILRNSGLGRNPANAGYTKDH